MEDGKPAQFLTLAAIASYNGFEDYALKVLEALLARKSHLESYDHVEKLKRILDSYSDRISQKCQKGIQRLWKKSSSWRVTSRKDGGYFIKD